MKLISKILETPEWTKEKIVSLLTLSEEIEINELYKAAEQCRNIHIGNNVYFRGLIEYSNRCSKNCFYCGIRAKNKNAFRYDVSDNEVIEAAEFAYKNNYASVVLQSGELSDKAFTSHISELIKKIHAATDHKLRITLSCGEQKEKVYQEWYDLGADRYLLRIEASNPALYEKIHPFNAKHSYQMRLQSLRILMKIGYQTGTGVMIGLPLQTIDDLASDLLFISNSGVHMVGMGPYIEHAETPLYKHHELLISPEKRVELSLKMIAILRLMRPSINIASTTALQTLDPMGREKGLRAGANVIMPNITPVRYKKDYDLYEGKPCLDDEPDECGTCLENRIKMAGCEVAYGNWGDSKEFSQ